MAFIFLERENGITFLFGRQYHTFHFLSRHHFFVKIAWVSKNSYGLSFSKERQRESGGWKEIYAHASLKKSQIYEAKVSSLQEVNAWGEEGTKSYLEVEKTFFSGEFSASSLFSHCLHLGLPQRPKKERAGGLFLSQRPRFNGSYCLYVHISPSKVRCLHHLCKECGGSREYLEYK